MVMIFQPKGAGTEHKEGTILIESPASLTGMAGLSGNYVINTYVSNLPTTGTIDNSYNTRFTGCAPCI
jgi:hypothetical protein